MKGEKGNMLINKRAVRQFIKGNYPNISKVESVYYDALDRKVLSFIVKSVKRCGSHKRLTAGELIELNGGDSNGQLSQRDENARGD
jgi:hypothetical protein